MTLELPKKREIRRLVMMSLNEDISPAETRRLSDLLAGDTAAQHYYLDLLEICTTLRNAPWLSEAKSPPLASDEAFDEHMWQVLAELERTAPAVPKPVTTGPSLEKPPIGSTDMPVETSNTLWPKVFSAAALVGLGLFIVTLFSTPAGQSVSRVTTLIQESWATADERLDVGQWVSTQDKLRHLTAGIVKLIYDNRAEVLIEGPAVFSCPSDTALILNQGHAYAYVPDTAKGFTINTPCTQLIDLGTEFGVRVDQEGSSTVQVFQGETELIPYRGMVKEGSLTAGMAKQIKAGTYQVSDSRFDHQAFVRYVNPEGTFIWRGNAFSLTDCIGSGNGFGTGRVNAGISLLTAHAGIYEHLSLIRGSNEYRTVTSNPFVDGVFIPSDQGQTVSSTGIGFQDCPRTSRFQGGGAVFVYGINHELFQAMVETNSDQPTPSDSQPPYNRRTALYLHANAGITFDLQAIRSSLQGISLDKFVSGCGMANIDSCPLYRDMSLEIGSDHAEPRANVFVLMDGEPVFKRELFPNKGSVDIMVEVRPEDRFLTLMVTEGADELFLNDLIVWTAPRLVLKRQSSPERGSPGGRTHN